MRALVRRTIAIFLVEIVLGFDLSAASAVSLAGDTVGASVRRTTDPAGTNYFSQSNAVVDGFTGPPEFATIDGDYEVTANFVSDYVNLSVDRVPISPNDIAPNYRFRFTDLDFTPASIITGVTRFDGTPGIGISDVVISSSTAEFTLGTSFLSNGGSFGISVRFDTVAIPEPGALSLVSVATALCGAKLMRRRTI